MAKKLSEKQIEELFIVYSERQSVQHVATICQVARATVRRYRDLGRWDERLRAIRGQVQARTDRTVAQVIEESLIIVRAAKARLAKRIQADEMKSQSTISDLDRIIRLEGFLMGQANSRPDMRMAELRGMSTKELLALLRQLEGAKQ